MKLRNLRKRTIARMRPWYWRFGWSPRCGGWVRIISRDLARDIRDHGIGDIDMPARLYVGQLGTV